MHHDYDDLQKQWKSLRGGGTFTVREVACGMGTRTLLCVEAGDHRAPAVTISAGMHGDEPAGVYALLELAQHNDLDTRFHYRLWPCVNPTGFSTGTRESTEGIDINRTFARGGTSIEAKAVLTANRDLRFELAIDLHEDSDASGFYCYEYGACDLAAEVTRAAGASGFPLAPTPVLHPDAKEEEAAIGGRSYTLALARRGTPRAMTLEVRCAGNLAQRIQVLRVGVKAAINALSNVLAHG